jgi:hypothetical protein
LKDITEATTPTKVNNLFKLHAIPCNYSVISQSLRAAAIMACAKLAKYFERADLMDMVYLSNAMDPRYKGEVIEKNLPEYATNILGMCFEKASQIYDILVLGVTETEESSAIQAPKKAQAIQDESSTRRIMNCLVNPDHADDVQNAGRYGSIETE